MAWKLFPIFFATLDDKSRQKKLCKQGREVDFNFMRISFLLKKFSASDGMFLSIFCKNGRVVRKFLMQFDINMS